MPVESDAANKESLRDRQPSKGGTGQAASPILSEGVDALTSLLSEEWEERKVTTGKPHTGRERRHVLDAQLQRNGMPAPAPVGPSSVMSRPTAPVGPPSVMSPPTAPVGPPAFPSPQFQPSPFQPSAVGPPGFGQLPFQPNAVGPPGFGQLPFQPSGGQPPVGPPGFGQHPFQPSGGQPPVGPPGVGQPPVGPPGVGQPPVGPPGVGQPSVGLPGPGQPPFGFMQSAPPPGGANYPMVPSQGKIRDNNIRDIRFSSMPFANGHRARGPANPSHNFPLMSFPSMS
uniref:Uncharacterized protein n=1 Tax=Glossina pallidipes TaxID=7398 RepID=A0A1A9ZV83_GLOPL